MSFTNQTLGALGTVSGALAMSEHLKQQKQANETAEAQKQVQIKDLEYANEKDNLEYTKQTAQILDEMKTNPLKDKEGNLITDPMAYKAQQMRNINETLGKYKQGKRKEAAEKARDALQDQMFTYTDLRFNMDKRSEQIRILKGEK